MSSNSPPGEALPCGWHSAGMLNALAELDVTATVVARCSIVRVGTDSMLVIEAFLPAMLAAFRET